MPPLHVTFFLAPLQVFGSLKEIQKLPILLCELCSKLYEIEKDSLFRI